MEKIYFKDTDGKVKLLSNEIWDAMSSGSDSFEDSDEDPTFDPNIVFDNESESEDDITDQRMINDSNEQCLPLSLKSDGVRVKKKKKRRKFYGRKKTYNSTKNILNLLEMFHFLKVLFL